MNREFAWIDALRRQIPQNKQVQVGIGDDCAVITSPAPSLLLTSDLLTEGVDFLSQESGFAIGRKAMAVNLSDIAAMAGEPTAALVGLVLPKGRSSTYADEVMAGIRDVADRFSVPIVGGDTNSWDQGLVVAITLLGIPTGRGPVLRSGAEPGDVLFVTGPLGGSLLGRHLKPEPRIAEAQRLHKKVRLKAMIDISDGLTADLQHLLDESQCGALLDAGIIPIHEDAIARARQTGKTPLEHALGDGEDFELLFAVSPADALVLQREALPVHEIGKVIASGLYLQRGGTREILTPQGWVHEF